MNKNLPIIPLEIIEQKILVIRGEKIMIDADLAELYGVTTKTLNQAVRRNEARFPSDFMFKLTNAEKNEVVTNCDHLKILKFSHQLPYAFTEHGVAMLSSVLRSGRAVQQKLQNTHINKIYSIIEKLIDEPIKPKGPMGFQ